MAKHFWYGFLYWAKTGKRSFGYIMNKRDYHHALDKYRREQIIKTEKNELNDRR
jgi:hypothetical protein